MLICDLCGSVSVWTGLRRASRSICPLLADLSGDLAASLQLLTFLPHYLRAPVSLFLQLWALAVSVFISSPFCLFRSYTPIFSSSVIIKIASCTIFPFSHCPPPYKSLFSPSTCPCRSAQIVPSSSSCSSPPSACPPCVIAALHQFVTDFFSVTTKEG